MPDTTKTTTREPVEYAAIGTIPPDAQLTVKDTGWTETTKATMQAHGFDAMDMVMAWYS